MSPLIPNVLQAGRPRLQADIAGAGAARAAGRVLREAARLLLTGFSMGVLTQTERVYRYLWRRMRQPRVKKEEPEPR